jgi:heat shock protein HtpX
MDKVHIDFRDQISGNKWKSLFLIISIVLVFALFGWVISMIYDPSLFFFIMIIAIVLSILYTVIGYYNSHKLAIASVRARVASRSEFPDYHRLVEGLTNASGLPKPELYVMDSSEINGFASGRDPKHSVICMTTGALQKLDRRELEGVLAHEMSHIANYDIRFITLTAVLVGMVAILAEIFLRSLWFSGGNNRDSKGSAIFIVLGIILAILAPIAVWLIQMAISRKREFVADASAVKFTRNPKGLIGALNKIKGDHEIVKEQKKYPKAMEPMFFSNPFKGWSSTHPPLEKRIDALERM